MSLFYQSTDKRNINIISFDVPYPANYGGVIDIFNKIKMLHSLGYNIYLHCYSHNKDESSELLNYCKEIYYYKRNKSFYYQLSKTPFIINTRKSYKLKKRLLMNDFPILFEGLHTCYLIDNTLFSNRLKIFRPSNIEHLYYKNLSKLEGNLLKKLYFNIESRKLEKFEPKLNFANIILSISTTEYKYFKNKYSYPKHELLSVFHSNKIEFNSKSKDNKYVLFHGNLSIKENEKSAIILIKKIFRNLDVKFIIAGKNPNSTLFDLINKYNNIELITNPDEDFMKKLILEAQINIIYTKESNGIKLKLINSVFIGKHCIANPESVLGTNLENSIHIFDTFDTAIYQIKYLIDKEFNEEEFQKRKEILNKYYDNYQNIIKLDEIIQSNLSK